MPEKEEIKVNLTKKPKGVTVVEGFPGFGLVGTIATGFLLDHLKCEQIGNYFFEIPPATIAIHECKMVDPISIYYNKKHNLVIIHSISSPMGIEWKCADLVLNVCKQLDAKELITLEGVGSTEKEETRGFWFTVGDSKKIGKLGYECLGEGIIVGVTAALMMKSHLPLSCMFAETHSKLPDAKAAAKIIEILDKHLKLGIDYSPLLKQAEEFEKKLRGMMEQTSKAEDLAKKKKLRYVG